METPSVGKSEIAFWAWVTVIVAVAVIVLSWMLNKGIRDIVKGVFVPLKDYLGNQFAATGKIMDQTAEAYGYNQAVSQTSPEIEYAKYRSWLIKTYGLTFSQAVNLMPARADFYNGIRPDLSNLTPV